MNNCATYFAILDPLGPKLLPFPCLPEEVEAEVKDEVVRLRLVIGTGLSGTFSSLWLQVENVVLIILDNNRTVREHSIFHTDLQIRTMFGFVLTHPP